MAAFALSESIRHGLYTLESSNESTVVLSLFAAIYCLIYAVLAFRRAYGQGLLVSAGKMAVIFMLYATAIALASIAIWPFVGRR